MAAAAHIDENQLAQLIDGALTPVDVEQLEAHVDSCPACSELMIRVARELAPDSHINALRDEIAGRYRITGELGAGGMGVVYRAFDETLHRDVALKLVRPDLLDQAGGADKTARLLREARALATLAHPNVVAVFDAGELDDRVFVATELVQGRTIRTWVAQEAPSLETLVEVYQQAGRGLEAAHAANIVHRDIKPDNILVGDDGRVRLADFGLATGGGRASVQQLATSGGSAAATRGDIDVRASTLALTISGAIVGTPLYMAPEQIDGLSPDPRSDQFSFCVSLYESRYRQSPFAGRNLAELMTNIKAGNLRAPELASHKAKALHRLIERGLSPDPNERFPSMTALLAALDAVAETAPPGADNPRWRRWVAAAAAAAALALAIGVIYLAQRGRAGTTAPVNAPRVSAKVPHTQLASLDAGPRTQVSPSAAPTTVKTDAGSAPRRPAAKRSAPVRARPRPRPRPRVSPAADAAVATGSVTREANQRYIRAAQRTTARDGSGCLAAFARADKLGQPAPFDDRLVRARCHMLAGRCASGQTLHAKFLRTKGLGQVAIDTEVARGTRFFCPASEGPWRTRMQRISHQEPLAYANKKLARQLARALETVVRIAGPSMSGRERIAIYTSSQRIAKALARFGRCTDARRIWRLGLAAHSPSANATTPRSPALAACLAQAPPTIPSAP